jgi:hydrogenase maturation protease
VTRVRVVCVGNALRGDDGAGLVVAARLRELAPGADVREERGDPAAVMEAFEDVDELILVDAVCSGAPAGTVHTLDVGAGLARLPGSGASTHGLGLGEAIELARLLGRLPATVTLYGIEGGDFTRGAPPSPAAARAAERVARVCATRCAPASRRTGAQRADAT